jgi:hypothetical protein
MTIERYQEILKRSLTDPEVGNRIKQHIKEGVSKRVFRGQTTKRDCLWRFSCCSETTTRKSRSLDSERDLERIRWPHCLPHNPPSLCSGGKNPRPQRRGFFSY